MGADKQEPLSETLKKAAKRALGGGIAGALAMVIQVVALMWMRTTINFQHAKGMGTMEAMSALYAAGGIARFYQGVSFALMQGPLSRFGDTASNAGAVALLEKTNLPAAVKTFLASCAAALFRIVISPIDTLKTTLQVQGAAGMTILGDRIAAKGVMTLFSGSLGAAAGTLAGHYPWFITYNWLNEKVPKYDSGAPKLIRNALVGFVCSFVSDVVSNSVRVVKTAKQTAIGDPGYMEVMNSIIAADGVQGLMFRGLTTKLISNGIQAMLFTVCWRLIEEKLAAKKTKKA